jgi:hypothetical protein
MEDTVLGILHFCEVPETEILPGEVLWNAKTEF